MRGGNSTHVSLYVCEDEQGYYFIVDGRSENMFLSGSIHNFMNLWEEDLAALPYVTWQEIPLPNLTTKMQK